MPVLVLALAAVLLAPANAGKKRRPGYPVCEAGGQPERTIEFREMTARGTRAAITSNSSQVQQRSARFQAEIGPKAQRASPMKGKLVFVVPANGTLGAGAASA